MSEVPVQLIVAAFQDEKSADMTLKELKQARSKKLISSINSACSRVIKKDQL